MKKMISGIGSLLVAIGLVAVVVVAVLSGPGLSQPAYGASDLEYILRDVGITNSVAAKNATNSEFAVIWLQQDKAVTLSFCSVLASAGTQNVLLKFKRGQSTNDLETTPGLTWTLAAAGTTTNLLLTNLYINCASDPTQWRCLVLTEVGNGNSNVLSIVSSRYGYFAK